MTSNRKYPIPRSLINPFPHKRNVQMESLPQIKDWTKWILKMVSNSKEKIAGIASICSLCYPFCDDVKRYEIIFKQVQLLTLLEDKHESEQGNFKQIEAFEKIISKIKNDSLHSMCDWEPQAIGLYLILNEIYKQFNETQKQRLIQTYQVYLDGQKEEKLFLKKGQSVGSIEEYIEIRYKSFGYTFSIPHFEYTENIFMPDHVWKSSILQKYLVLQGKYAVYVNDIYSFERELKECKSYENMVNSVALLCHLNGITVEESMERVANIALNLVQEIKSIEKELLNNEDCLSVTKTIIERMNYMTGGLIAAYSLIERYS